MANVAFASPLCRRLSLETIDAAVSCRLGPTRVAGNEQPACFNRQVAMYLAKHVGGWSTTLIGRFYNGRDHSTVSYGIQRIGSLRGSDPEVDALLTELKQQLGEEFVGRTEMVEPPAEFAGFSQAIVDQLADIVAARVCAFLEERMHRSQALSSSPTNQF
ncbi:MAG: helix-turn-helix domain-containing protein [Bryobacteraceae bacterium]